MTSALHPVGCIALLDRFLPRHEARNAAFRPRPKRFLTPELTGRARNADTNKLTMKDKLKRAPVQ
jgi:hypothetical protein